MATLPDLSSLSREQIREIRARADFMLGAEESTDGCAEVYAALVEAAGPACPPLHAARRSKHWPAFSRSAPALLAFAAEFKPRNRAERRAALMICVEVFSDWLAERRIPVYWSTLASGLDKVPGLVDRAFPGYRASGMLPAILRSRRV